MPGIAEFIDNPERFLLNNLLFIDGVRGLPDGGPHRFSFDPSTSRTHRFKVVRTQSQHNESIRAYWLPFEENKAPIRKLGDKANYFFTDELTGCRIVVGPGHNPYVQHVAGTFGRNGTTTQHRDTLEALHPHPELGVNARRRFSVSEYIPPGTVPEDKFSVAFVGVYRGGKWDFIKQVKRKKYLGLEQTDWTICSVDVVCSSETARCVIM